MAAAQGFYHVKSFTEEGDTTILFWRLAENRLAEINHNSTGAPICAAYCLFAWNSNHRGGPQEF